MRLTPAVAAIAGLLSAASAVSSEPVDLVDPFIGSAGRGSCMPGPCLPHASIYPSPDTLDPTPGGYRANRPIVGFSQLHTQGTGGNPSYGNFLITPWRGLVTEEAKHASPAADETARAYAYSVRLTTPDVRVDVTPSRHSAIYRFTFPDCDDAHLTIDVARKIGGALALEDGSVHIDPKTGVITGGGRFAKNWNPAPYSLFFAARTSATPVAAGTWVGRRVQPAITDASASGQPLGAYLQFKARRAEPIYLKIAVSFTSAEQAQRWLDAEIPGWNFEQVQASAADTWRRALSAVEFSGVGADETRTLYTALWHALVQPRDRTGDLPDFPAGAPIWDDHYTLWDTWKTVFPLLALVQPEAVRDNVNAFITRHERNPEGVVTSAFIQGHEFKVGQGGNEADNIIADAFAKQIPGIDWEKAYAVLRGNAEHGRTANYRERGWVAADEKTDYSWRLKSGSGTLAFSYNDYNTAQVAKALGHTADYERYAKRAGNWRNVWDKDLADEGFTGFVHSRKLDGSFLSRTARGNGNDSRGPQGYNRDFYEGTWWEYSNDVPHDLAGVTELMGGREAYLKRLSYAFRKGYIDFGNEPAFMMPWILAQLGKPYLTSYWADQLRRRFSGLNLPGDDDSGAMSSLYVFLTAGVFPIAGQDVYWLHGARIPVTRFHLANGNTFTIEATNPGAENIYVQSATLNGAPLETPMLRHAQIVRGGTLHFVMGPKPSGWGTQGEFDPAVADRELAADLRADRVPRSQ